MTATVPDTAYLEAMHGLLRRVAWSMERAIAQALFGAAAPPPTGPDLLPTTKSTAILDRLAFLAEAVQALAADADSAAAALATTKRKAAA